MLCLRLALTLTSFCCAAGFSSASPTDYKQANCATCQSFLLYSCWPCLHFNLWSVIKCVNISSRADNGRGMPSLQSVLGDSDLCLESLKLFNQYVITIYTERPFNASLVCVWSTPTSSLQTSHKTNPTGMGWGLNVIVSILVLICSQNWSTVVTLNLLVTDIS